MDLDQLRGRIIDGHTHLGDCRVFGSTVTEHELISAMDAEGVSTSLVMPYPGDTDPVATHDRIASLADDHSGRIYGIVNLSPHIDRRSFENEATRCVRELDFVALKLHTIGHAVNPLSEDGETIFALGDDLGVPVIVHTGPGVPFALPALCLPAARQYPELKIILAHAGHSIYFPEALVCAQEADNVYLETSWITVKQVQAAVSTIGASRVMMGSDGPPNLSVALAHYAEAELDAGELEQSLCRTPAEVFGFEFDQ